MVSETDCETSSMEEEEEEFVDAEDWKDRVQHTMYEGGG